MENSQNCVWNKFTNLYALSKTLRFELKPYGEKLNENGKKDENGIPATLYHLRKNMQFDKELQTFLKDQDIEDAYQVLKPVFDKLHEDFINNSLENVDNKKLLSFDNYLQLKKDLLQINRKDNESNYQRKEKEFETEEKRLRSIFENIWKNEGERFKNKVGKDDRGIDILKEDGYKILTEAGILKYIKMNIDEFSKLNLNTREEISYKKNSKDVEVQKRSYMVEKSDLEKALGTMGSKGVFDGFFTYFSGFNQNRENYYSTEEKSTAVANRIVGENLPIFCDNILVFEKRKDEYENAFEFLKSKNITLKDKKDNDLHEISSDIFSIFYFNQCLSQKEIDDYNKKIRNANFICNLYNQQHSGEENFKKLPKFKELYKQIGCGEKDKLKKIKDENDLKENLMMAVEKGRNFFKKAKDFTSLILGLDNYNGVYWSNKALNTISSKYFINWDSLKEILGREKILNKNNGEDKVYEKYKIPQAIELSGFFDVLDKSEIIFKDVFKDNNEEKQEIIKDGTLKNSQKLLKMIFVDVEKNEEKFIDNITIIEKMVDFKKEENIKIIKNFLDILLYTNQILKYFYVRKNKIKGSPLNAEVDELLENILSNYNPVEEYDSIRNYLTQKPTAGLNKLKLNFGNGVLLQGWSDGQEKSKLSVILRKNGVLYLGILKKRNIFDTSNENNPIYQNPTFDSGRLILSNLKFQTLAGRGFLADNNESYGEMGKRDPLLAIERLQKLMIDRGYIEKYPKLKEIAFGKYNDKKIFDKKIQEALKESYICEFRNINWDKVEEYVNQGDLYLFEIKNRKRNIQNLYWQEIFRKNSVIQLAGQGEIFYRPALVGEKKEQLKTKDKYGKEIYKHFRFTKEKFLFHCATKFNYQAKTYSKPEFAKLEINKEINKELIKAENVQNVCFLGIDRGEKNLAYYSLINNKGEILKQGTLNVEFEKPIKVMKWFEDQTKGETEDGRWYQKEVDCYNYCDLIEARASNRDEARKNWKTIGTIKELKDGYISQVVRIIVDLAIKNNAYIVLENLNTGFKRGRQKIEKSVYQKLELALAKKLNFVVDKNAKEGELMSVQRALQLTPPVNNFDDIEKSTQYGIMLYTRANYTSQTDPITGWRKTIYFKSRRQEDLKAEICNKFNEIVFDGKDYIFKYKDEHTNKEWQMYSGFNGKSLDRFCWKKNKNGIWQVEKKDIVEILDLIFGKQKENIVNRNLKEKITNENVNLLKYAIELIQQIRNNGPKDKDGKPTKDDDFILSPVRDERGNHFDSRQSKDIPNGDANGAYNIARKGLMMFERIQENFEKPDLYIKDEDWDKWLQLNKK